MKTAQNDQQIHPENQGNQSINQGNGLVFIQIWFPVCDEPMAATTLEKASQLLGGGGANFTVCRVCLIPLPRGRDIRGLPKRIEPVVSAQLQILI